MVKSYKNYYQHPIDLRNNQPKGLKLVLGGTGLGKTSGIKEVITDNQNQHGRFIYVANRLQLLTEMQKGLPSDLTVLQQSDEDILKDYSQKIDELFNDSVVNHWFECLQRNYYLKDDIRDIQTYYKTLTSDLGKSLRQSLSTRGSAESMTREVFRFFRTLVRISYQFSEGKISFVNGGSRLKKSDFHYFTQLAGIQQLFPLIDFKYNIDQNGVPRRKLLLVSLQKFFHGLFDGRRTVNLMSLHDDKKVKRPHTNNGFILFLDEFDFLEADILNLIAEDIKIEHPFRFVKDFYHAMKYEKLPSKSFLAKPEWQGYKEEIQKIVSSIDELKTEYNIDYPNISHFICDDGSEKIEELRKQLKELGKTKKHKNLRESLNNEIKELSKNQLRGSAIMQTRYTIAKNRVYLDSSQSGSFNLVVNKPNDQKVTAFALFNTVNQTVPAIIRFFKELEHNEPNLYKELLRNCFETSKEFQNIIRQTRQLPQRWESAATDYDKFQKNGFSIYEIEHLDGQADPTEVRINYFSIFLTPEKVIIRLAENHLVFGLSATGELPRLVKNFDINYLRQELGYDFIEPTADDFETIRSLNETKQNLRNSKLMVKRAKNLDVTDNQTDAKIGQFWESLKTLQPTDENGVSIFGGDTEGDETAKVRLERVSSFLKTLQFVKESDEVESSTNLVFYNSLKQIKYILSEKNEPHKNNSLFSSKKLEDDSDFSYFEVEFEKQQFIVVAFDAKLGKQINISEKSRNHYLSVFKKKKPVIVITTYPSAANGVNLQYNHPDSGKEQDFKNLHLLDAPFAFFEKIEYDMSISQKESVIKRNIHYLFKLERNWGISQTLFNTYLQTIRQAKTINSNYLKTEDGLVARVATLVQALGRIERVWDKMPNQTLRLSTEVSNIFEDFLRNEAVQGSIFHLKPTFSNHFQSLLIEIERQLLERDIVISHNKQENLADKDQECAAKLRVFLDQLNLIRKRPDGDKDAIRIRNKWQHLRLSALKQDFYKDEKSPNILDEYSAIFSTRFFDPIKKVVYINNEKDIAPINTRDFTFQAWNLESVFGTLRRNEIVESYFDYHRYQLGFRNSGKFFVPIFWQSILSGAIGEEAVKAVFAKPKHWYNIKDENGMKENRTQSWTPLILEDVTIPNALFELADFRIQNTNWFVDCKNYSISTLIHLVLPDDDPLAHPKLNDTKFRQKAIEKYREINSLLPEDPKLIFVNAVGSDDFSTIYYDAEFNRLSIQDFSNAKIIVIAAMLDKETPTRFCDGFVKFLNDVQSYFITKINKNHE